MKRMAEFISEFNIPFEINLVIKADAFIEGNNRQSSSQIFFSLEVKTITKIARKWDC